MLSVKSPINPGEKPLHLVFRLFLLILCEQDILPMQNACFSDHPNVRNELARCGCIGQRCEGDSPTNVTKMRAQVGEKGPSSLFYWGQGCKRGLLCRICKNPYGGKALCHVKQQKGHEKDQEAHIKLRVCRTFGQETTDKRQRSLICKEEKDMEVCAYALLHSILQALTRYVGDRWFSLACAKTSRWTNSFCRARFT